jgi:hypothetical protein
MTMVAKTNALSYSEISGLDVYEFFLIVTNLERQNKEKQNG